MSLESLLKPVKWLDEQILRQYTKVGKKWEDKGKDIYSLSLKIGLPSYIIGTALGGIIPGEFVGFFVSQPLYVPDVVYNFATQTDAFGKDEITDSVISINPITEFCKRVNRIVRLPTFILGSFWFGKTSYDILNQLVNNKSIDYDNPEVYLIVGLGLLGIASSQYLKDRNPKLLDKEPAWKKAYDWLREKVNSLVPEPIPKQGYLLSVQLD